jgi:glycosyltransferase involved in cell wall biosynthesis
MAGDFVDDVNVKNMFSIGIFSFILNKIEAFIIRRSDATIVLSKKALAGLKNDKYLGDSGSLFEHIPCCVDISKFKNGNAGRDAPVNLEGRFVVSYIGSLGTCYLLKEMAGFFKVLKRRRGNAVFLIVSHTDGGYIESVLKGEGLKRYSDYFIMGVSPEDVPSAISKSRCSIMFIKPVECKIGSSPTKFGESLAGGIPVVINKGIGDTEDVVIKEGVGILVEGFEEGFYEKAVSDLFHLLEEDGLRDRCLKVAEGSLSLDLGVRRYTGVYEKMIR